MKHTDQTSRQPKREALAPLLTSTEAASVMRVVPRMVTKMCNSGELKAVRIGNRWRINRDALLAKCGLDD